MLQIVVNVVKYGSPDITWSRWQRTCIAVLDVQGCRPDPIELGRGHVCIQPIMDWPGHRSESMTGAAKDTLESLPVK